MRSLYIDEPGDFLQCAEHLQSVRMHLRVARSEREVRVDVLVPGETVIQYRYGTIDNGAPSEAVYVACVHATGGLDPFACLGTGPLTVDTFAVQRSFVRGATPHTGSVVP